MNTIRCMRFALTAAVLAVGSLSASATERIYTQNGDGAGFTYFPEGNWSTGNKSFEPGDDVVYRVADNMVDYAHYIAVTNAHTTFGALSTTNLDVTLEFANWKTGAGDVNLTDLSDWAGMLWFFRPDAINFTGGSTTIRRLRASGRARLKVSDGDTLVVSNFVGRGMVKAEGTGELELVRTSGDLAGIHFSNGDLTLHGDRGEGTDVDVEAVLARAMIHLDAQNTASLTLENGKVKVWSDPVGGGQAVQVKAGKVGPAYQSYIDIPLPAYVADYNGSGKPVVDFGPYKNTNETDFATSGAASLKFRKNGDELRDNANHVFIVFADNDDRCRATPFNDSYNRIFQRGRGVPAKRNNDQTGLSTIGSFADYGSTARTGRDAAFNGSPVQSMFQFGGRQLKIAELDYRRADNSVPKAEKRIGALARYGFDYWGGVVIGEIIVFSGDGDRSVSLTDAERTAVNDYLRRKWLSAEEQPKIALNELHYGSSGAIRVPAGGTARVRHCIASKDGLSKDGSGTLLVGDFSTRRTAVVDVKDGAFGFAHRSAVSDAAPAAGARHHFDADEEADSIVSETVDGVRRVLSWNDEDVGHEAAVPVTDISQKKTTAGEDVVLDKPWVVENMLNGRRGISLGRCCPLDWIKGGDYTNAAALVYSSLRQSDARNWVDGDFREGFVVVRFTDTVHGTFYAFGTDTSAQNMHNMGNDASWAHPDALGASVSWNGVPYDLQEGLKSHFNEFGVLRFACGDAQPINAIGLDRYTPGSIGGLDICEYITYDRILTDRERIDTEAYLMKKWLGKDHPLKSEPTLAEVKFAADKEARIVAESDATVGGVDTPQGDFTKSGDGRLAAGLHPEQLTGELKVSAGALEVADGTLAATLKKAVFHVDASDASTIITNAEGYVTRWNDVRGVDFYAENWSDWPGAKPTVAKADCNGMDTIDFGVGNLANGDGIGWSKPEAKAACAAVTTGSGLKWSQRVQLVEGYQIFKLTADKNKPPVVGSTSDCNFHPDDTYIFNRNGNNTHYDVKYNSLMLVDDIAYDPMGGDEAMWATYKPKESYRMYGFAVTNKTQTYYPWGASFAYERHQRAGGMRLAEGVFFSQALTAAERQAVIAYLRHKWQVGVEGNVLAPASVEVAKGASLAMDGLSLKAGGYSFEIGVNGVDHPLSVGEELIIPDGTTIALRAEDGFRLSAGVNESTFELIRAKSVSYGENLVLDVDAKLARHYAVTLVKGPDSVSVTLSRTGMLILIR